MRRRLFLLLPIATSLRGDAAQEIIDLFAAMAASLSASEPIPFFQAFDRRMPGYQKLVSYVEAMTTQYSIVCSMDPLSNEGDDRQRKVELDWLLQLSAPNVPVVRRRQKVTCRLERQGKKWKIVSLDPIEFFR